MSGFLFGPPGELAVLDLGVEWIAAQVPAERRLVLPQNRLSDRRLVLPENRLASRRLALRPNRLADRRLVLPE